MKKNPLPDSVFANTKQIEENLIVNEKKQSKKLASLMVRIDEDLFTSFKIFCAKNKRSIKSVIEESINKIIKQ